MNSISLKALAKINLGLDVLNKRSDGYHEVRMIMQTINLYDELVIQKSNTRQITLKTNLSYLPINENNLVYKAANLLMEEFKLTEGVHIDLQKHIPVAAGLAGGSSDAAATLVGMNELFQLNLSKNELMKRGASLGADIPYCILRGTALSEGIGEILTPIPPMVDCFILIAKPDIHVSTKFVYENLILDHSLTHPNIQNIMNGIRCKNLNEICNNLGNVLESVTIPHYPVIQEIKSLMIKSGARGALMSGSGPTVFGIFDNHETAVAAEQAMIMSHLAKDIVLTTCYNTTKK